MYLKFNIKGLIGHFLTISQVFTIIKKLFQIAEVYTVKVTTWRQQKKSPDGCGWREESRGGSTWTQAGALQTSVGSPGGGCLLKDPKLQS